MREGPQDMGATATVEIDTEIGADAQTVYQRTLEINKELKGQEDDKVLVISALGLKDIQLACNPRA